MTSVLETDLLADLIQRKRSCLVQIRDIGARQMELVREGSMTDLLELLATKQHVLMQLQQLERQLDRFRGEDPEQRQWRTAEERLRCAGWAAQCETLLAEIMEQEKHSERDLMRRRDEAASRLEGAHTAAHARGAYLARPPVPAGELDLVSDV